MRGHLAPFAISGQDCPLRSVQQGVPEEQQIVVVEHAGRLLAVDVAVEKLLQLVVPILTPGKMMLQRVVELFAGVDASAVDRHARPLLREPLVGLGEVQIGADDVHQVFGIGPVVDGEMRRQADGFAVAVQQAGGDGVVRAAPDARRAGTARAGEGDSRRGAAFRRRRGG